MPCYHPLRGWRHRVTKKFTLHRKDAWNDVEESVPCGRCDGCRLEYARQWAIRCMHEASLHEDNCFITLTLSDEFVPDGGSLKKSLFQRFMKRLRKKYPEWRIRYFHCGEYGSIGLRPHYHALLFGFDFPDKQLLSVRRGFPVWTSAALCGLWPEGLSEIGSVTYQSAAYVARYCLKKASRKDSRYSRVDMSTGEVRQVEPEYTTMSRRPGIGKPWLDRYMCEVYPADSVVVRGRLSKPPRYYDNQFELGAPLAMESVKRERERRLSLKDTTPARLAAREAVCKAKLTLYERGL